MIPELVDPDRHFAVRYAAGARTAVEAIWAFDEMLGQIVAGARDPLVGQMRLTWWHEAVSTLRPGMRHGQPILDALASEPVIGPVIEPASLAAMVEGWEALLEPLPLGDEVLSTYAVGRGGTLFDLTTAAAGLASARTTTAAGEGWALVDFAKRCSDPRTAARAWSLGRDRLQVVPRGLTRPLRILARLARADAQLGPQAERTRWALLRAAW